MADIDLAGVELRQKVDENGEPMVDEDGNPIYETLDGETYAGSADGVFVVRGFPITNENGAFLFTDAEGKTVLRTENEDGTYVYTYEDGTAYEGSPDDLTQQLEEQTPVDIMNQVTTNMEALVDLYENGGSVEPGAENYGIPTAGGEENPEEPVTEGEEPEPAVGDDAEVPSTEGDTEPTADETPTDENPEEDPAKKKEDEEE